MGRFYVHGGGHPKSSLQKKVCVKSVLSDAKPVLNLIIYFTFWLFY